MDVGTLPDSQIVSRFSSWTRYQLVKLLIGNSIELRGEHLIPTSSLRELAEDVSL